MSQSTSVKAYSENWMASGTCPPLEKRMYPTPRRFGTNGPFGFLYSSKIGSPEAAIILNAGLLHNVGPFRLHVQLAEVLHDEGLTVVRIDQSGKGESPAHQGMSQRESLLQDYDAVMEVLRAHGIERTLLVGLCSGADDALIIARERSTVSGAVLLDGFAARDLRYFLHRSANFARRLVTSRTFLTSLRRSMRRLKKASTAAAKESEAELDIRNWQSPNKMYESLDALMRGGVKVLALFTGGVSDYYNHQGQLGRHLQSRQALTEVFLPEADHLYRTVFDRDRVVATIQRWAAGPGD